MENILRPISTDLHQKVLEDGYVETEIETKEIVTPEIAIWRGVISQAVKDADTFFDADLRETAIDSIGWLLVDQSEFIDVCAWANIEPETVRSRAWKYVRARIPEKLLSGVLACYEMHVQNQSIKETMPLQLATGGGGGAFLRFSIEDNEWLMSGDGDPEPVDIVGNPVFIDIEKVEMGWLKLTGGRDFQPWPNNIPTIEKPSDEYKQAFQVNFYSSKLFKDEPVRQLSSSAAGLLEFIRSLYNEVELAKKFETGEIPVVKIQPAKKIRIGRGPTKVPQYQIAGYKPRPEELNSDFKAPSKEETSPASYQEDDSFEDMEV